MTRLTTLKPLPVMYRVIEVSAENRVLPSKNALRLLMVKKKRQRFLDCPRQSMNQRVTAEPLCLTSKVTLFADIFT